jgi:hypothetical protein
MKEHRIVLSIAVMLILSISTPQFAQDTAIKYQRPEADRTSRIFGFIRTINTAEVVDLRTYGSYSSWQTLLAHDSKYLDMWRTTFYPQEARFGGPSEILPGLNLRLNAHDDGQGYDILLEDTTSKTGYAVQSDERGIIRECWLPQ